MLLLKCDGDEIWSVNDCRKEGVPEIWIKELRDCFESGFNTNQNTIYKPDELYGERMVNQYEGVLGLHLALKLAEFIGIDWESVTSTAFSRRGKVEALKDALDDL